MSERIAIGIGCRKDSAVDAIVDLLAEARRALPVAIAEVALFTLEDKRREAGMHAAAAMLRLPLVFLPREALRDAMPGVTTRSAVAEARFGLASVAEAAALAGAGPGARLLLPRIARNGVTCAVARAPKDAS